jgi:hypothetical protein
MMGCESELLEPPSLEDSSRRLACFFELCCGALGFGIATDDDSFETEELVVDDCTFGLGATTDVPDEELSEPEELVESSSEDLGWRLFMGLAAGTTVEVSSDSVSESIDPKLEMPLDACDCLLDAAILRGGSVVEEDVLESELESELEESSGMISVMRNYQPKGGCDFIEFQNYAP